MRSASKQVSPIDLKVMVDANQTYGGHFSYPALLTGAVSSPTPSSVVATGPSIDQMIADNLLSTAGLSNTLLNVGCRPYKTFTSYRSAGTPNAQQTDPYKLFTNLMFGNTTMPATQVDALFARRKSVLDSVGTELTTFSKNLGTEDKSKVQVHLDSIRSLEAQLTPHGRDLHRDLHRADDHPDRSELQHHRELSDPRQVHVGPGRGRGDLR